MILYVGNLSFDVTARDLWDLFADFGEVMSVTIMNDEMSGRPSGFGFVFMPDTEQAEQALSSLNMTKFRDRVITLSPAEQKKERRTPERIGSQNAAGEGS